VEHRRANCYEADVLRKRRKQFFFEKRTKKLLLAGRISACAIRLFSRRAGHPPHFLAARAIRRDDLTYFCWLSLLPRRLMPPTTTRPSNADWQATHVRTPGTTRLRPSGMASPHSTQCVSASPVGILALARDTPSTTVSSI
jgi:hypothetical protein